MTCRTLIHLVEGPLYIIAQWNGKAGNLGDIQRVGFDLQLEEGSRTGDKPLIVYDPKCLGHNPIMIQRGEWAVRDILNQNQLRVLTDKKMMDLIALLTEVEPIIIRR